ncbi:pseudouridine synthase [Candidatus Hydrogenosomobacter endosymbioticus]|uniref:Pseudouridine synthase n=1 Tax=Candidatus Hydrogenosomobacter endosymbioticus TaxID=2558174 RepID=A0ABM7V926_9PROT|nr:pseudouridine synthase [Candidatus Hydrogenosomobacter endosymbioticus]BDB96265.1 hypothetical protein HYD_3980 [Candidatus Hydrogenosomobacter endosymbioticus]
MKLDRWLFTFGKLSRREADKAISEGRVTVDGIVTIKPFLDVDEKKTILLDGALVQKTAMEPVIMKLYKPRGVVVSKVDQRACSSTVFDLLPKSETRWIYVGRLDIDSEGLLLLTNVGRIAHFLESPKTALKREYMVKVFGHVDDSKLSAIQQGPNIKGINYSACKISVLRQAEKQTWLKIVLTEGKNREIRILMDHIGLRVSRLIRTAYGPFTINNMKPGEIESIFCRAISKINLFPLM